MTTSVRAGARVAREELERVAREYRRVREEHRRARRGGHTRRHLGARLERLGARFEHLLAEAEIEQPARRRWRDHLRHGGVEPEGPMGTVPLLFRGRSDAGSELRLLAREDGGIDALVDGATVERLDSAEELTATMPGLSFRLEGVAFGETFLASPTARAGLRESLESGAPLERSFVGELLADGIVDRELGVTARGRRALGLDALPAHRLTGGAAAVSISMRGPLPARARVELEEMLARIGQVAPRTLLRARVSLVQEEDRALERPVVAKAQLDLAGRVVRAHVAAAAAEEAVDLLEARLRRNLLDLGDRAKAARKEGRPATAGEWRHGDLAGARPAFFDRPAQERRLVRRKSYAAAAMTAEEAAWEMRLLDHDFHLFADAASGEDALVYLHEDGVLGLKRTGGDGGWVEPFLLDAEPAPTLSAEQAIERLDTTQAPFLFFVEDEICRAAVLYRRYDGDYGLVTLRSLTA